MIFRLTVGLLPIFIGFWLATQKLASLVKYDALLGNPFTIYNGEPYYLPWKYITWYFSFYHYIPQLFSQASLYIFAGFLVCLLFLFLLRPEQKLTSHGTACWATYNDILKMDLISSSGVVVGLYDNKMTRAFTSLLRALEFKKKEKVAFAEIDFDSRVYKKRDKMSRQLNIVQNKLIDLPTERPEYQKLTKMAMVLQKKLDTPIEYNAKLVNPYTVYPWVLLYKKAFEFYVHCPHFYLRDNSNKHLAVIAPTRSGKGVGLIITTLLGGWLASVIVNDIKSENWGVTAGCRKKMGHVVIKFEPTAEDGSSARWNPLEEIAIGSLGEVSATQNLAAVIADYEGTGKPDHWTANAANVIMLVILHMKYAHYSDPEHYPNPPNLYTVASFLKANIIPLFDEKTGAPLMENVGENGEVQMQQKVSAKGFIDTLTALQTFAHVPDEGIEIIEWDTKKEQYVKRIFTPEDLKKIYPDARTLDYMPNVHPIIYQGFIEILSKAENECASIVSTANTALKEYLDPVLAKNTSVSDFCIDDLMNYRKPVSLYLVTPPSDLIRLAPIFRLFFEMMVRHHAKHIGTYEDGQAKSIYKHKCLFLMDEFSSLGNLKSFAATFSFIAGYGMKVFLINQGLPQINDIYGKDNQLLMNCHLQIFYAPNDNDTAKYTESMLGPETIKLESVSDNGLFLSQKNYSSSETGRALMNSDEVKRLGEKEIIVASGSPPVLTDKVKYYENDFFRSRLVNAPVASDVIRNNPYPERDLLLQTAMEKKRQKDEFTFEYNERL